MDAGAPGAPAPDEPTTLEPDDPDDSDDDEPSVEPSAGAGLKAKGAKLTLQDAVEKAASGELTDSDFARVDWKPQPPPPRLDAAMRKRKGVMIRPGDALRAMNEEAKSGGGSGSAKRTEGLLKRVAFIDEGPCTRERYEQKRCEVVNAP